MTLLDEPRSLAGEPEPQPILREPRGRIVVRWITSTDHKIIGFLYLITSFVFFLFAGVMALMMRAELARPGLQFFSEEQYNQLFTMHGSLMLLLFATPLFVGFANCIVPLQIGSPDVAFPRLNMFSYWLFLFGGIIVCLGFVTPGGAASFGWFAYTPLSNPDFSPGAGVGPVDHGLRAQRSRHDPRWRQLHHHDPVHARARHDDVPDADLHVEHPRDVAARAPGVPGPRGGPARPRDRQTLRRAGVRRPNGGPILWQHLFWFFGHPEVYIIALPFFGIVTEILPVFSRKPIFGYKGLVFATISIAALSVAVWAHHMYVTGAVLLPFFAFMTMLIAVPTGVKFFNWIGTLWRGSLSFDTPLLWALGFLVTFLFGGLTGIILSAPPLDFSVSDSYFVVAHFHYVVFGTVVFAMFGGFYFWWPKFTGKMLDERLGKIHFWLLFIGFHTTFLVQHWLGVIGMPRRYADYLRGGRLHDPEHHLHDRRLHPRCVDAALPLERLHDGEVRTDGRGRRPLGLGSLSGVGDVLPAAPAQLRSAAPDPLRVTGLRPSSPRDRISDRRGAGGNLLDQVFGAADQDPADPATPATTAGSQRAEEDR